LLQALREKNEGGRQRIMHVNDGHEEKEEGEGGDRRIFLKQRGL